MSTEDDPSLRLGVYAPGEVAPFENQELLLRLQVMNATHGFVPTSADEANDAYNLLTFLAVPGKTAMHLNEILIHQTTNESRGRVVKTDDPTAAVRSVTRGYASYAMKARGDQTQLALLRAELSELDPEATLKTLAGVHLRSGIPQLVRYHDLRHLVNEGTVVIGPFMKDESGRRTGVDPYTIPGPTKVMQQHIGDTMGRIRVWQAKNSISSTLEDQANRRAFWTDRLHEARAHAAARPVATVALQDLGVIARY